MVGFSAWISPPSFGDDIFVLSTNGGGIGGIIRATIVDYLDIAL